MFLHVFDSGFRPTNQTTQYDDSSRSRHVTLYHTYPQRSKPSRCSVNRHESQTRDNWGLSAHQPTLSMQYSTIYSTNNTKHKTQICTLVLSLVLSVSRRCGVGWRVHHGHDDDPFIVLTETKFSFRCIPVGIGTLLTGLGSTKKHM